MDITLCRGLVINAPAIFADPAFQRWLTNGQPKFTWHSGGEFDEYSDLVVLVDPGLSGEGSDSDMPSPAWDRIVEACRAHLGADRHGSSHYVVRLTNLQD